MEQNGDSNDEKHKYTEIENIQVQQILKKYGMRNRSKQTNDDEDDDIVAGSIFDWQSLPLQLYTFPIVKETSHVLNSMIFSQTNFSYHELEKLSRYWRCTCKLIQDDGDDHVSYFIIDTHESQVPILSIQIICKKCLENNTYRMNHYLYKT
tara:strand:+ start:1742 stop:2194 length:453 start_codon:yes stop_codon:yes gene_type:complete